MSGDRYWLVVPAAGIGKRMGGETPKQYLPLAGRSVLAQALHPFSIWGGLAGACVALSPHDLHFDDIAGQIDVDYRRVSGGAHRMDSVRNALLELRDAAADDDWVLVHDAVRPCLSPNDLCRLVETLGDDPVGGLLARRATDTLKRDDGQGRVERTEDRGAIWYAETPQMFRFGPLVDALTNAVNDELTYSDESAAMEAEGHHPRLVESRDVNIKITRPADLRIAESVLDARRAA